MMIRLIFPILFIVSCVKGPSGKAYNPIDSDTARILRAVLDTVRIHHYKGMIMSKDLFNDSVIFLYDNMYDKYIYLKPGEKYKRMRFEEICREIYKQNRDFERTGKFNLFPDVLKLEHFYLDEPDSTSKSDSTYTVVFRSKGIGFNFIGGEPAITPKGPYEGNDSCDFVGLTGFSLQYQCVKDQNRYKVKLLGRSED